MNEQQQAQNAVTQWMPVVQWLGDVEAHVSDAPTVGSVDDDQVQEAADAVRAARLALSALLGEYVTAASMGQQPEPQPQPNTAQQPQQNRNPVAAPRPGEQLQQQPGPQPHAQPAYYAGGWQS